MSTVLFAGGGSGGHIFPNAAVVERLREQGAAVRPHFVVSQRDIDRRIMDKLGEDFTALPAAPLVMSPKGLWRFYQGMKASEAVIRRLVKQTGARACVSTGGFVSGPTMRACARLGLAAALVNLDAVPGKANRMGVRWAREVFTVYPQANLPRARTIGLPLRHSVLGTIKPSKARWDLGLRPDLETIVVTAGSQGAASINQMMMELVSRTRMRRELAEWQVIHLSGAGQRDEVAAAYEAAGVRARVEAFCNQMGLVWSAATLAITRAGAGSVAEVWANRVPAIFLPYPYHKDEHQKFNCEALVNGGAAMLVKDQVDPIANVAQLSGPLVELLSNDNRREGMRQVMARTAPPDGAAAIAGWLATTLRLTG